jgi:hypothetical protein
MSCEKSSPTTPTRTVTAQLVKALLVCLAVALLPNMLLGQRGSRVRTDGPRRSGGNADSPAPRPATPSARSSSQGGPAAGCGTTPQRYQQLEYGSALHALEISCSRKLSTEEQVFIAGLTQRLLEECGFPADQNSRAKLLTFVAASNSVGSLGTDYSAPRIRDAVSSQAVSITVFAAGNAAFKVVGCTPLGRDLAEGVVDYLDRTSTSGLFVDGCAKYYEGRYTRAQCQCVADVSRAVEPDIHTQAFSRESFPYISRRNPFVGLQVALQCRIGDY